VTPARAWVVALGLSAAAAAAVVAVASALERRSPGGGFHPRPIEKVDVHQHVGPGTLGEAMRLGATQGIRALVNLSGGQMGGELEEQLAAASRFPGRVAVFESLDFDGCCSPSWIGRETARLAQGRAAGARGVKVYKSLGLAVRDADGRVPLDSPKLDPVWRLCGQLGLVVAVHAADPRAFFEPPGPGNERAEELAAAPEWSFADRARYPPWRTVFEEFVRLVERHPATTFIGVHFGNDAEDPEEVSGLLGRLPNLYVDTAARVPELGRRAEAARAAILAHPDRILFGTDLQWVEGRDVRAVVLGAGPAFALGEIPLERSVEGGRFFDGTFRFFETRQRGIESPTPIQGRWSIDGIGLPGEVLERVYHRNAERLLGFAPPEGR
jgi:hypothetical protein